MCSRKKVFVKDSMLKRNKMSFLFISLPLLSDELLRSINKLKKWDNLTIAFLGKFACIYIRMSAWVLIPHSKPQPCNFFCLPGTEKLSKSPRADKKPRIF